MRRETRNTIEKCIAMSASLCHSLITVKESELQNHKSKLEAVKKRKPCVQYPQGHLDRIIAHSEKKITEQQESIDRLLRFESITNKEKFFKRIKSSLDKSDRNETSFRNFLAHDLLVYGLTAEISLYFCHNLWFLSQEV